MSDRQNIDNILTYIFIKRLVSPISKSKAYSLGIVNNAGRKLKNPETDEEKAAYTILDKLIFKLKRLLGSKLINLNSFLYLSTLSNDFYNKLIVRGSVDQRAEIIRIKRDLDKIAEKYEIEIDDVVQSLIIEKIQIKGDSSDEC